MKYGFPTMTCTARRIERAAGVGRFRGKTDKGEISTAPSPAILAHPGKPISPETSVDGVGCRISTIMPQPDLLSPKTSASVPTRVEFPTAARSRMPVRRRMRATVENSCTAVHHLTKALFLSKPAEPLLPFLGGQGPAPGYAMALDETVRARLRDRIRARIPVAANGSISLTARAWATRATVAK